MRIVTLIENTEGPTACAAEHGLSFYVETQEHRILVDTGASAEFLRNASILGVDLQSVDTVVISHGHYDHTGGLLEFAKQNPRAAIYLQRSATGEFYHPGPDGDRYIGMNPGIAGLSQCRMTDGNYEIDGNLSLLSGITGRRFWPEGNRELKRREQGRMVQDDFRHEQCLTVTEGGCRVLFSGCAHNGILNILEAFEARYSGLPDVLFSGFHMKKKGAYTDGEMETIRETARILQKTGILCYSGHCTGEPAFALMKEIMGEKLQRLYSGCEVSVEGISGREEKVKREGGEHD